MTARSDKRSSDIVDLVKVLILFMSKKNRSASALLIGRVHGTRRQWMLGKASRHTSFPNVDTFQQYSNIRLVPIPIVCFERMSPVHVACFIGCQSFRLQVDSPTSRSFRLHNQVISSTHTESIRLH